MWTGIFLHVGIAALLISSWRVIASERMGHCRVEVSQGSLKSTVYHSDYQILSR